MRVRPDSGHMERLLANGGKRGKNPGEFGAPSVPHVDTKKWRNSLSLVPASSACCPFVPGLVPLLPVYRAGLGGLERRRSFGGRAAVHLKDGLQVLPSRLYQCARSGRHEPGTPSWSRASG